jgi:FtsP/CotA-like multicopper oxidase with cupredoxin domain
MPRYVPTRRVLLQGMAAAALLPRSASAAAEPVREFRLATRPANAQLAGTRHPATAVWAYNGTVPGPEIRARQGERVRIVLDNGLDRETTLHCHGVRLPNAMDGVPHLTQPPIAPGKSFTYEFAVPDPGTYWYHPHASSSEQVGRGLAGALIVEERDPIRVDRDIVWLLSDWRLARSGQIADDFGDMHDMAHDGRIGNTVTVNGQARESFAVRSGERIRLRLINAANARLFALAFSGHRPTIVAFDGQPVTPHAPDGDRVVLGPGMRADLVLDMTGKPGERFQVTDSFYRGDEYRLLDLVYDRAPLRDRPLDSPIALPPNTLPEPDMVSAVRHELTFDGGMMGRMMMGGRGMGMGGGMGGGMMGMMQSGRIWLVNGVSNVGHDMAPMLTLNRNRTCVLAMSNETAWWHPIHLHGHSFRVVSRSGAATRHREWLDTVLLAPRERVEVAFVADNPGDWMLHCHILEHQESGMMGVIRVA